MAQTTQIKIAALYEKFPASNPWQFGLYEVNKAECHHCHQSSLLRIYAAMGQLWLIALYKFNF